MNWLVYYPVEKMLSRWTDVLITINHEDYKLAKMKFKMKKLTYVPGIGIDTQRECLSQKEKEEKERRKREAGPSWIQRKIDSLTMHF